MTGNPYAAKLTIDILQALAKAAGADTEVSRQIEELKRVMERDLRALAKQVQRDLPPWEEWT